jgi:hypothetical protein
MRHMSVILFLLVGVICTNSACQSSRENNSGDGGLPDKMPFELTRLDVGQPLSTSEISAFTDKITGFWKQIDYFRWTSWHSHSVDKSVDPLKTGHKFWWQDTIAVKEGDTVTFRHVGWADNIMERTPKVLNQAIAGYLMFEDPIMKDLIEQYCYGFEALFLSMIWGNEDPLIDTIMSRANYTIDHSYTTADGRKVQVDYGPVRYEQQDWNAHTINNPDNPTWGDIWVRNMRSKDDVPYLLISAALLLRLAADAPDESIRQIAMKAYDYLKAFAVDIVDSGYLIRTKDKDGLPYVPEEDLASFVTYEYIIPNAECTSKISSAYLAYGDAQNNDCANGISQQYEIMATASHYFNNEMIRFFHVAAIVGALMARDDLVAKQLLEGMIVRADEMIADEEKRAAHNRWDADLASFLVVAATYGLPLTSQEARLIQERYSMTVDLYQNWEYWDLWDSTVPDGEYNYIPNREDGELSHIRIEEMAFFLEYCYSPWRNPAGVEVIDCAIVSDPSRWGP